MHRLQHEIFGLLVHKCMDMLFRIQLYFYVNPKKHDIYLKIYGNNEMETMSTCPLIKSEMRLDLVSTPIDSFTALISCGKSLYIKCNMCGVSIVVKNMV